MKNIQNRSRFLQAVVTGLIAGLILNVFHAQPVYAGMVIEEKNDIQGVAPSSGIEQQAPQIQNSKTYIQARKMRSESEGHIVIIDFDKRMIYNLNPKTQTYTEMTLEQLQKAQKEAVKWINDMKVQMQQNLSKMPPENREELMRKLDALNAMTDDEKPAKVTVKATGKKQTINGYPCSEYEVYENGEKASVSWVTTSISTKEFDNFQKEMNELMADFTPSATNRMEEWKYLREKGFPIKTTRLKPMFGKISMNREVTKVETQSLSESLFQPPANYKRQELPQPGKTMPGMQQEPSIPGKTTSPPGTMKKETTK